MSGLKFNEDNLFWRNPHLISGVIFIWSSDFISRSWCPDRIKDWDELVSSSLCKSATCGKPLYWIWLVAKTLEFNTSFHSEPHLLLHLMVKCSVRCVVSLNLTNFPSAEGIGLVVAIAAVAEQNQHDQSPSNPLPVSPCRTLPMSSVSRCVHEIKPSDLFRISRNPRCLYCCLALA